MTLKFDEKKLKSKKQNQSDGILVSIQNSFSLQSISTCGTETELKEDINRIGGFSSEKIDKETVKKIKKF
jgi:hypothetical protein